MERKRVVLFVLNKEYERIERALRFSLNTFAGRNHEWQHTERRYEGGKAEKKKQKTKNSK